MKISIKPHKVQKQKENEITSSKIFKKNQRRVADKYNYDEDGLFSPRIFGRFGHCECGELTHEGYCERCETRVVDPKHMPDFYIDLGVRLPKLFVDYGKFKEAKPLLEYKSVLLAERDTGEFEIIDADKFGIEETIASNKIAFIGEDAAKILFGDEIEPWLERNTIDAISVPHPFMRPNLRMSNGVVSISPINRLLKGILENLELINDYKCLLDEQKIDDITKQYFTMGFYSEIYTSYITCMKEIFKQFAGDGKKSFLGSNLRAHRVTGAIKATVVNRFDIDEDVVLIGDTFVQTLYPYLYKLYDGDMEKINQHLIFSDARVLLNRAPTICHLSIMGMKPRIASCYKFGTFNDGALGANYQSEYDKENDTIGIRTIAINPIITDGLAGDFDGDTLLVIAIYSEKARKEADSMLPSKNYMNYANGEVRNVVPEDIVFASENAKKN